MEDDTEQDGSNRTLHCIVACSDGWVSQAFFVLDWTWLGLSMYDVGWHVRYGYSEVFSCIYRLSFLFIFRLFIQPHVWILPSLLSIGTTSSLLDFRIVVQIRVDVGSLELS